jgi:glycosyltransferase involved in cell wall biosynthesis
VPTVAYLANQFPSAVEPYVMEEIQELRRRGVKVIAGSVRQPKPAQECTFSQSADMTALNLEPLQMLVLLRGLVLAARHGSRILNLLTRVLMKGKESPKVRLKALAHTWLGACYAVMLQGRGVDHIHVHHGYFGSWIAMVAARLLGISFSMTLHGSDLLLHGVYLDTKLKYCESCVVISNFNRRFILDRFPEIDPKKIRVARLGVDPPLAGTASCGADPLVQNTFNLLTVGRLHKVKNHEFLVQACARFRDIGFDFQCAIAGEGPERERLELLISRNGLQERLTLLGHVGKPEMDALYRDADLVVLTSVSEGIPLVLMEAMARGKIVLAPAITGIPELVIPGKTGFLYRPGELEDFIKRICFLQSLLMQGRDRPWTNRLDWIRHAARVQVLRNYSRELNLKRFADAFLQFLAPHDWSPGHENPVLQQI